MNATTHTPRETTRAGTTAHRTPRRFIRCIVCGTWKKERGYALCSECYRTNGVLGRAEFAALARHAEREAPQYSYRRHPAFEKACRVYGRRWQARAWLAEPDAVLATAPAAIPQRADRFGVEEYDGVGAYELGDVLDWQMHGAALPRLERSGHRELSDEAIARWDASVDAWAAARGVSLATKLAAEIRPWGYAMEIDGATVWTDDVVLG